MCLSENKRTRKIEYTFIRYFPIEVGESCEHARLMRHDPFSGGSDNITDPKGR